MFLDFPGFPGHTIKFQVFPGFPGPLATLVVCDEILLAWKINSEKEAGNQDKCAGLVIKN